MTRTVEADPATLQLCATLARSSAAGLRSRSDARAHHDCGAGALEALATEFEAMANGEAGQ